MTKQISLRSIKAWLKRLPEDDVVGSSHSGSECPVANFIREAIEPRGSVYVGQGAAIFNGNERRLSPDVERLVCRIDWGVYHHLVTAKTVLAIIERLEQLPSA